MKFHFHMIWLSYLMLHIEMKNYNIIIIQSNFFLKLKKSYLRQQGQRVTEI